jgi:uncharacterized protein (DUF362 family)
VSGPSQIRCFTQAAARLKPLVLEQLQGWVGNLRPRRIVIKPNWVIHESDPAFPIRALVTDARLIEAAVDACLRLFPGAEQILIGDCPLQSADWPRLCRQSGLEPVIARFKLEQGARVVFRDLRREAFQREEGGFLAASRGEKGDPCGYQEVELGAQSHLEPLADQADRFAVHDYSAAVTRSNHAPGSHRYLVCRSVLEADLFINLPKWKSHAKAGLTGALKNLVGINGDKAYLPHFRRGAPVWGGDEYDDRHRWLYWLQTTLRETVQKRSRLAYRLLKPGWLAMKRLRGIETRLDNPQARPKDFYIGGGGWYGNQTIWRMIQDLNRVIQCADACGRLQPQPARRYLCLVDGLISGEGNGPLYPLPRETDWLIVGDDPFAVDTTLAWFMGFDPAKIPLLAQRGAYTGPAWGDFELDQLAVEVDGQPARLVDTPINFHFAPPPGWRDHIERG